MKRATEQYVPYRTIEKQIRVRMNKSQELVKGTSAGPWVRWKGYPHVMQGPAQENTESYFRGTVPNGDGTIAECDSDSDMPKRRARRNATFIAASRELVPTLAGDVEWLMYRLGEYRAAMNDFLQDPSDKTSLQIMRELLRKDDIEVP